MNESARLDRIEKNRRDAAPLIAELSKSGFLVENVADLLNDQLNYRDAIPILLEWLPQISNQDVKEDVVRALSVKWAKPQAAPLLVDEFLRVEDSTGAGIRWAIGNALSVSARRTPSKLQGV